MKVICFVSSKGGCGKSFVVKNLSRMLSSKGKRVLVSEFSYGGRYLDIFYGVTDSVLYNLSDCLNGDLAINECITNVEENLDLICTSLDTKRFDINDSIVTLINEIEDKYDYLFLDVSRGEITDNLIKCGIDCEYFVVLEPHRYLLRNAEALVSNIDNGEKTKIVINRVNPLRIEKGYDMGVDEIIDYLHIPLAGVVYEFEGGFDEKMDYLQKNDENFSQVIFDNISKRIDGENVPVAQYKKTNIVKKLFG